MKKALLVFLAVIISICAVIGCGKKLTEKEHYDLAYKHMSKEKWSDAEASFKAILDQYPDGELYAKSIFMIAYINANHIQNYEKAKEYYNKFLEKYPDHDLADDARYEIKNMGKNIDELPFMKQQGSEN